MTANPPLSSGSNFFRELHLHQPLASSPLQFILFTLSIVTFIKFKGSVLSFFKLCLQPTQEHISDKTPALPNQSLLLLLSPLALIICNCIMFLDEIKKKGYALPICNVVHMCIFKEIIVSFQRKNIKY